MKKFVLGLAVTVISAASLFVIPTLADKDCKDNACPSQKQCQGEKRHCRKDIERGDRGSHHGKKMHCRKMAKSLERELDLTEAQRKKADPIFKDFETRLEELGRGAKDDFEKVLTKEQKAELEKFKPGKAERPAGHPNIKLSEAQKATLKQAKEAREGKAEAAFQELKGRLQGILTSEQQQKLSSINFREFRHRKHGHGGPRPDMDGRRGGPRPYVDCRHDGPRADMDGRRGGPRGEFERPPFMMLNPQEVKELNLTSEQEAKIANIFDKHRKSMRESKKSMDEELMKVLTAEQKAKLEKMKENKMRRRGCTDY
ncbi:hypothetical protein IJT10_08130 [bacterium]|nr:hypothetical protein [bacterium]